MWFCYILRNRDPRYRNMTYNGSTNDPIRRLRQHNEEISGGAKATHGKAGFGKSTYYCPVSKPMSMPCRVNGSLNIHRENLANDRPTIAVSVVASRP